MGDAAGQLADRLHFLALRQLHFQGLALGLVDGKNRQVLSHALQPGKGELNQAGLLVHDGGVNHNHGLLLALKLVEATAQVGPVAFHHHGGKAGAALGPGRIGKENRVGRLDDPLVVDFRNADGGNARKPRQRFPVFIILLLAARHNQRAGRQRLATGHRNPPGE